MPADVGIEIQDHKRKWTAMEYEVLFIMLGIAGNAAEDTLIRL